ncbi:MAG: hypothetical protein IPN11_09775 [Opitutaceae bacterium]|nr:hypothetical protein [Opitutaceae bacterium]
MHNLEEEPMEPEAGGHAFGGRGQPKQDRQPDLQFLRGRQHRPQGAYSRPELLMAEKGRQHAALELVLQPGKFSLDQPDLQPGGYLVAVERGITQAEVRFHPLLPAKAGPVMKLGVECKLDADGPPDAPGEAVGIDCTVSRIFRLEEGREQAGILGRGLEAQREQSRIVERGCGGFGGR